MKPARPVQRWSTRLGVILAVTGSAVGLGNFLRFPGKAAQYEGGAFMIPYFVALLLLGLPIAWAEWTLGRYGGARGYNSIPGIFRAVMGGRVAPYLGVLGLLIPVVIYMYYVYIEAWCLGYFLHFATGQMALGSERQPYVDFFVRFVGLSADGAALDFSQGWLGSSAIFLLICFLFNFVLIYRGLSRGIELFCRWAMPLLVLCALVVLVRVLTLGTPDPALPERNVLAGLGFMWNPGTPDKPFWQSLANAQMWLEAAGQIFFSLSVGFGIVMCYASYLRPRDDIALSSVTAASGNEFFEVALGGMITVPAAFVFLGATDTMEAARSTFNLGFMTLPMVFASMPFGQIVGALFFFLLFLAAMTSSVSMLQPAIALMEEGLGLGRRASTTMLGFVTAIGAGFVLYFSKDAQALDTLDFWVGTFCIYVLATIQVLLFGWVLGAERGHEELMRGALLRIPRVFIYVIKYVSPVYLIGIFVMWGVQQLGATKGNYFRALATEPVARLAVGLILLVAVLFLLLVSQSVRRWDRADARRRKETP